MNPLLDSLRQSGRLRRADVALGAWLLRAFDAPAELALAAALAARAVGDGHSALELARAQAWLNALDGSGTPPALPDLAAWRQVLQQSPQICASAAAADAALTPLLLDAQDRLYLRRYFDYERQLAQALVERTRSATSATPTPVAAARLHGLDADQQRAVTLALAQRFTLVTGGPGSGKTFVVARMLAALAEQACSHGRPLRIALAAPTGKAAARLGESLRQQVAALDLPDAVAAQVPHAALTLHKLLGLSPWRMQPTCRHDNPLPVDVVVVDEVSMVDLPLMAKLVAAVPQSARLVLLGDPDQLAAVEAGNVLGALVAAAQHGGLRDCHVALTHSHRFGAGSELGALAGAITGGDAERALSALSSSADLALIGAADMRLLIDTAVAAGAALLDAADAAAALRAARDFRVLTALRHGPLGCIEIDRAITQGLQRRAGMRAEQPWWRGRLLLITVNRPELGLYNGDTGVVWPAANGELQAWFEAADGTPRGLPLAALPPHEGAFALTVHKAQGSEFERVLLVTGPDSAVLTRELLYTGVTRARRQVEIHSSAETLRAGIHRRTLRMGGLAERLREVTGAGLIRCVQRPYNPS